LRRLADAQGRFVWFGFIRDHRMAAIGDGLFLAHQGRVVNQQLPLGNFRHHGCKRPAAGQAKVNVSLSWLVSRSEGYGCVVIILDISRRDD
jgi:hypothetical protein